MIAGRQYLEHGRIVTVATAWNGRFTDLPPQAVLTDRAGVRVPRCGPHNVAVRRADGTLTIRPFRGLRRT